MNEIFKNVKILSDHFGYFGLTVKMMGLNKNGEFKMWINEHYGDNRRQ
jgi:hypothetical protein